MSETQKALRLLLISDTHGKLDIINDLADRFQAEGVIHAGDFGFYDDGSYERLSTRELGLQVIHSELPKADKDALLALPAGERIKAVKEALPLSEFPDYMTGRKRFRRPVYAVWGNHEDIVVVDRLYRGELQVENLHLLHHRQAFRVGSALVYGLGGNFLASSKLLQQPLAGGSGRIWSTLSQYADLVELMDKEPEASGPRIFVSHVSPGKEPFVEFVGARTRADVTVSGHMGAPNCMVWNSLAIRSVEEAEQHMQDGFEEIRKTCLEDARSATAEVERTLHLLSRLPEERIYLGRRARAPRWYRDMTHVNLPDAHCGYAVMEIAQGRIKFQAFRT